MTDVVQQSMVRPKADELVALAVIPSKFSRVDRTGQDRTGQDRAGQDRTGTGKHDHLQSDYGTVPVDLRSTNEDSNIGVTWSGMSAAPLRDRTLEVFLNEERG